MSHNLQSSLWQINSILKIKRDKIKIHLFFASSICLLYRYSLPDLDEVPSLSNCSLLLSDVEISILLFKENCLIYYVMKTLWILANLILLGWLIVFSWGGIGITQGRRTFNKLPPIVKFNKTLESLQNYWDLVNVN